MTKFFYILIFLFILNLKTISQEIEKDKIIHFTIANASTGFLSSSIYFDLKKRKKENFIYLKSILFSNLTIGGLGILKETFYDLYLKKGVYSNGDLIANFSGIFTDNFFFFSITYTINKERKQKPIKIIT